jgi:hypothetical protein
VMGYSQGNRRSRSRCYKLFSCNTMGRSCPIIEATGSTPAGSMEGARTSIEGRAFSCARRFDVQTLLPGLLL